jgi:hypothetical protein
VVPSAAHPGTVEVPLVGKRLLLLTVWEGSLWIRTGSREAPGRAVRIGGGVTVPLARVDDLREALRRVVKEAARTGGAPRL